MKFYYLNDYHVIIYYTLTMDNYMDEYDDMPALSEEIIAMPALSEEIKALEKENINPIQNNIDPLHDAMVRMLYHLPIPNANFDFVLETDKYWTNIGNGLFSYPKTEEEIFKVFHYEKEPQKYLLQFVERLDISINEKVILINEIFAPEFDVNNMDTLYKFVSTLVMKLNPIPIG